MKLFIQVRDGVPFEHPVMEDNMRQLFPSHDLETAPEGFAKFVRVAKPELGVYERFDTSHGHEGCGCEYVLTADGCQDVWHVLNISASEKEYKIRAFKAKPPRFYTTWVFDEATCSWQAPVAYPSDNSDLYATKYAWRDSDSTWVAITEEYPTGSESYYFNVTSESWVVLPTPPADTGYVFNYQTGFWVSD